VAVGIGFSAGIMLALAVELLPEAYSQSDALTVVVGAGAGVALIAVLHVLISHTHLIDESDRLGAESMRTASLVAAGLILHDVPEGFALANSYVIEPRVGVAVGIAIAVHNVPEEFAMAVPAVVAGHRRFLLGAAAASALAEPLGALIGLAGVHLYPSLNAGFLAFAAGAMGFVSLHELLPMAGRLGQWRHSARGFGTGIATYLLVLLVVTTVG
jgi:ZIP family zinc transporter